MKPRSYAHLRKMLRRTLTQPCGLRYAHTLNRIAEMSSKREHTRLKEGQDRVYDWWTRPGTGHDIRADTFEYILTRELKRSYQRDQRRTI